MEKEIENMRLEDYIIELRSKGKYTLNFKDLQQKFPERSKEALRQSVFRLKSNNSLAHLRREFYLIIPPEYSSRPGLPLYLFIDDLMKFLGKEYYVGLFSAASLHGASHQSPMTGDIVVNGTPVRPIESDNFSIKFYTKKIISAGHIIKMKSDSGYFNASSAELTAIDLIYYSSNWGIERVLTVISDLIEHIKPSKLYNCALEHNPSAVRKLGFLFDEYFREKKLADKLYAAFLKNKSSNYLYLAPSEKKEGEKNSKWLIVKNIDLGGQYDT